MRLNGHTTVVVCLFSLLQTLQVFEIDLCLQFYPSAHVCYNMVFANEEFLELLFSFECRYMGN